MRLAGRWQAAPGRVAHWFAAGGLQSRCGLAFRGPESVPSQAARCSHCVDLRKGDGAAETAIAKCPPSNGPLTCVHWDVFRWSEFHLSPGDLLSPVVGKLGPRFRFCGRCMSAFENALTATVRALSRIGGKRDGEG